MGELASGIRISTRPLSLVLANKFQDALSDVSSVCIALVSAANELEIKNVKQNSVQSREANMP